MPMSTHIQLPIVRINILPLHFRRSASAESESEEAETTNKSTQNQLSISD